MWDSLLLWLQSWAAWFGGTSAALLLILASWRWRLEYKLRVREVAALEKQAYELKRRNDLFNTGFKNKR